MKRIILAFCAMVLLLGAYTAQAAPSFSLVLRQHAMGGKHYIDVLMVRDVTTNTNRFRSWQIKIQFRHDATHELGIDTTTAPVDASTGWRDLGSAYNTPTITYDFAAATYPKWVAVVMPSPPTSYTNCIPWTIAEGGSAVQGYVTTDNEVRIFRLQLNLADSTKTSSLEWFATAAQTAAFTMTTGNVSVGNTRTTTTTVQFPAPQLNKLLPVELTSFTGQYVNNSVKLDWRTATETSNYGFNVLRATTLPVAADDASQWEQIGFVQGAGTSSVPHEYTFTDESLPRSEQLYYRLLQTDRDGKTSMSSIVRVMTGKASKFEIFPNYPNPFTAGTQISFALPTEENVIVKVYNDSGEEVTELLNGRREAGFHTLNFNGDGLPVGVYRYTVTAGNSIKSGKMILSR